MIKFININSQTLNAISTIFFRYVSQTEIKLVCLTFVIKESFALNQIDAADSVVCQVFKLLKLCASVENSFVIHIKYFVIV